MPREMRRSRQAVDDPATLTKWLQEESVGRLTTVDEDGYPVTKPVNFAFAEGTVYFHSAVKGEKLDDIQRNPLVGFEVDREFLVAAMPPGDQPCDVHAFYRSIIIRGRARVLHRPEDEAEKEHALRLIVRKYAPERADRPLSTADQTAVVAITVERMSGRVDSSRDWSADRKSAVANWLRRRFGDAAEEVIAEAGLDADGSCQGT